MNTKESREREVAKWVEEENKKDHLCACGCGEHIEITEKHFEWRIPRYIKGHNRRKKSLSKWITKEQGKHRVCACGCRQEIKIRKAHFYHGIPKYIKAHVNQNRKVKDALEDYNWMVQKYQTEMLNGKDIGEIIGCSSITVIRHLKKLGIKVRVNNESKKGVEFTKEHKEKIGNANRGKTATEEAIRHLSESHKGIIPSEATIQKRAKAIKEEWASRTKEEREKFRERARENRKQQRFPNHHTSIELIFGKFAEEFAINPEYTGDGKIWIGNINPDFIIRDIKVAIFINGDYWHSPLLNRRMRYTANTNYQIKTCKKHKWKALIIWEGDLNRKDANAFVYNLLKKEGVIK